MKKKIFDENMPIGKLTVIPNFLPPPDQLIFPGEEVVKVTISLRKDSVDYFKKQAKKNRTKYQKMIREVLHRYARQHQGT